MIRENVRDEFKLQKKSRFHQNLIIACVSCAIGGVALGFGLGFGITAANILMRPVDSASSGSQEVYTISGLKMMPTIVYSDNEAESGYNQTVNTSDNQPFLGIVGEDLSEDLAAMYDLPQPGVFVRSVIQGAPADIYGLKRTDIIIGFNDEPIYNIEQLVELISCHDSDDNARIKIIRDGKTSLTIDIVLSGKPVLD